MDTHGGMVRLRRRLALIVENHGDESVTLYRQRPNQSLEPTAGRCDARMKQKQRSPPPAVAQLYLVRPPLTLMPLSSIVVIVIRLFALNWLLTSIPLLLSAATNPLPHERHLLASLMAYAPAVLLLIFAAGLWLPPSPGLSAAA